MNTRPYILLIVIVLSLTTALSGIHAQDDAPQSPPQFECAEDLTGKSITIYHFGDISAIYTFITAPLVQGFADAIDYFNANGGICGAEIRSENYDTGASLEAAQAIWDDVSTKDDAHLVLLYMTEDSELLREQAAEAQIPILVSTGSVLGLYGEDADAPGWVFALTPLYEDQLGAFCDYIAANWESLGIEGDPVIGHVSWLGTFGESSDTDETRAYCDSLGIGYAGAQYYFPIVPDISTQVETVVANGANIIYTTSVADGPARLASTAAALELGVGEQVLLAGPNWVLDNTVVRLAGDAAVGMIGQLPYYWWDDVQHPGIQTVTQYWAQNRLAQNPDQALELRGIAYLVSWGAVDAYRNVMIDTINRVGFDNLSGAAVYDTLTSGTAYLGLEGVIQLQFDDQQRSARQTRIGQIQIIQTDSGVTPVTIPLTDWVPLPDLRPGGADTIE